MGEIQWPNAWARHIECFVPVVGFLLTYGIYRLLKKLTIRLSGRTNSHRGRRPAVGVRSRWPISSLSSFESVPSAHSPVPSESTPASVPRLPSFLWECFCTRYSSVCCAILPAQKALDNNEVLFSPLSIAPKDCKTDETGGKSLSRSR